MGRPVYIVMAEGPMILGGYWDAHLAQAHSNTETGASVVCVEVCDHLPEAVIDRLGEDFEEGNDTPVTEIPSGNVEDVEVE